VQRSLTCNSRKSWRRWRQAGAEKKSGVSPTKIKDRLVVCVRSAHFFHGCQELKPVATPVQ
jgi:hypothetical protein